MNERYLFKAKRIDNGEWIQGYLCYIWERAYICWGMINNIPDMREVDLSTICQCTGIKDRNGKLIWENDIIKHEMSDAIGTVKWYQEDYVGWCVNDLIIDEQQFTDEMWSECEVVGNIFDNSELLKGEENNEE